MEIKKAEGLNEAQLAWARNHDWYLGSQTAGIVAGEKAYRVKVLERITWIEDGKFAGYDNVKWFSNWQELRAWAGY